MAAAQLKIEAFISDESEFCLKLRCEDKLPFAFLRIFAHKNDGKTLYDGRSFFVDAKLVGKAGQDVTVFKVSDDEIIVNIETNKGHMCSFSFLKAKDGGFVQRTLH